jgi:hypothetical protein
VFEHACRLGAEGIVSKRDDGTYRSGPCPVWIKVRNPANVAVRHGLQIASLHSAHVGQPRHRNAPMQPGVGFSRGEGGCCLTRARPSP